MLGGGPANDIFSNGDERQNCFGQGNAGRRARQEYFCLLRRTPALLWERKFWVSVQPIMFSSAETNAKTSMALGKAVLGAVQYRNLRLVGHSKGNAGCPANQENFCLSRRVPALLWARQCWCSSQERKNSYGGLPPALPFPKPSAVGPPERQCWVSSKPRRFLSLEKSTSIALGKAMLVFFSR